MANVESMIVEEKTQIKQIDREKVRFSCKQAFYIFLYYSIPAT